MAVSMYAQVRSRSGATPHPGTWETVRPSPLPQTRTRRCAGSGQERPAHKQPTPPDSVTACRVRNSKRSLLHEKRQPGRRHTCLLELVISLGSKREETAAARNRQPDETAIDDHVRDDCQRNRVIIHASMGHHVQKHVGNRNAEGSAGNFAGGSNVTDVVYYLLAVPG